MDPTRREQYLTEIDFQIVFHMSKEAFNQLDKQFRIRLKKEKLLF
jgi:hypothetical protein